MKSPLSRYMVLQDSVLVALVNAKEAKGVTTVAAVWIPLAAELTPANRADNEEASELLAQLPAEVRFILGDVHYNDPALVELGAASGRLLVTTKRGPYPHHDDGVGVRRVFHKLRSLAIENFNGQFKDIFGCLGQVPTRGLVSRACAAIRKRSLLQYVDAWPPAENSQQPTRRPPRAGPSLP